MLHILLRKTLISEYMVLGGAPTAVHLLYDLRDPDGTIVLVADNRERYWSLSRWCAGRLMYCKQFMIRTTNAVYKCDIYKLGPSVFLGSN